MEAAKQHQVLVNKLKNDLDRQHKELKNAIAAGDRQVENKPRYKGVSRYDFHIGGRGVMEKEMS